MSPRRLSVSFLLVLLTLLLSAVASGRAAFRVIENEKIRLRTQLVIVELRGLQSAVLDAEAAKYAYVYGNRLDLLTPYYLAGDSIKAQTTKLLALTRDNPRQLERATYLMEAVHQKYARIDSVVTLRRVEGQAAAAAVASDDRAYRLLARVRLIIDEMTRAEEALMKVRSAESQRSVNQLITTFGFIVLLAVALVSFLYRMALREFEMQRIEAAGMAASNERLSAAVDERTQDLQRANQHLHAIADELQRSNRELQDFAHVASHDLQEPLRKIRAFTDLLLHEHAERLDEEARHFLARIDDAASRMSRLISALLAYSRVNTKAGASVPTPLSATVSAALDDLSVRLDETDAVVDIKPLPVAVADPSQLHQLFLNLLSNALKFSKKDTPSRVEVWAEPAEPQPITGAPMARVYVRDHGIGFDAKYAERIFAPFERLHGRANYEGTGIGLAVCRRIVERHGGTIRADAQEGEGATFVVTLPVETPFVPVASAAAPEADPEAAP